MNNLEKIAMLIGDDLIIHSATRVCAELNRAKYFMNTEHSRKIAFSKQFDKLEYETNSSELVF